MTRSALVPRESASLPEEYATGRGIEIRAPWLRPLLGRAMRLAASIAVMLANGLTLAVQRSPRTVVRLLLGS
ncbi:hypothetical protein [Endothiovibrio diazotrophicus]